jgi:O-antigen/teichoic acid export membrane protein
MADVILLPLLMLVVTPYFIYKLGADYYGVWMLVNSIMVSIGVINVGIGDAAIKFVSKYKALHSKEDISRITNAGFLLTIILFFAVLVIGFTIALIIGGYNLFNLTGSLIYIAKISVVLGGALFGLKQAEQFTLSIFKGFERYDTSSIISMISKFLLLTTQVVIVYMGYSIIQIFIGSVIVLTVIVICELIYVKSRFAYISLLPKINKVTLKEIFSFSSWSWIQSVLSILVSQADKFVVITLAGPAFLAYYSLASTIGSQIHSLFTAAVSWVFPKISSKTEKKEAISILYYKMQFLIITGGLVVISGLLLFGDIIFKLWLGPETYNNSILLIRIFLFYIFVNLLSIIPHFTLLGANQIKNYTYFVFISVIITISSMLISYHFMGIIGLAYGKMFSAVIYIPLMLIFVELLLIKKNSLVNGILLYLPSLLIAIALYLRNYYSLFLIIPALLLLFFNFKTKVLTTNA